MLASKGLSWRQQGAGRPDRFCGSDPMLLCSLALAAIAANSPLRLADSQSADPFAAQATGWGEMAPNLASNPAQEARMPRVSAQRLHALMQKNKGVIVVDARDPQSFATLHVAGAVDMPLAQFATQYRQLPKDRLIALYCT
ncbi:MAG: rhodanese-like domain-containing protein [Cyanobacteria bacterium REEB65]|nr:rhodanese-like domain-containing protein [Cyanobacteria bacterium REEB65]